MKAVLRRLVRPALLVLALVVLGVLALAWHWRRDPSTEILRLGGEYGRADEVARWTAEGAIVRYLELHDAADEPVARCWVRTPALESDAPRIAMLYAGAKTGKKILDLIPDRPGLVLVGVEYPYVSPDTWTEKVAWPATTRRAAMRAVAGGMLAVSYLERDASLPLDRLIVVGSSLGTFPATIHAALDPRVPTLLIVHGGGHLPTLVRRNVRPPWLIPPARLLAEVAFEPFDPLHWVERVSPRGLVMIAARNDRTFPAASAERLYARAGEPKEIRWTDTGHVRSSRRDLVDQIVVEIEDYLQRTD